MRNVSKRHGQKSDVGPPVQYALRLDHTWAHDKTATVHRRLSCSMPPSRSATFPVLDAQRLQRPIHSVPYSIRAVQLRVGRAGCWPTATPPDCR